MGIKISKNKKRKYLSFIQSNFSVISQRKMAKILDIGRTTVNRWSSELGLKFKKHTVNEKFFDKLNENSVYLLGYIYADGNICWNPKKGYQALTITAAAKDKEHLKNMRTLMSSTKPLLYSSKTNSYRLIVNNKKICQRLMQLGVTPRKSLTVKFPNNIPSNLINHFIRGIIDGDGNVRYVNRKRSPYFEITIASGSQKFCQGLVNSINQNFGIKTNIRKAKENTFILQYSCSKGEKLANFIYSNSNIFLDRKYLAYKKIHGGK